jgi:hypothetical protein
MKRRFVIVLLLIASSLLANVRQISSASNVSVIYTNAAHTTMNVTFTGTTDDGGGLDWVGIVFVNSDGTIPDNDFAACPVGATCISARYTASYFGLTPRPPVYIQVYELGNPSALNANTFPGLNFSLAGTLIFSDVPVPPGTFWNPNDDRVDPRPGDRLAVWCNQPDKVVVLGTADDLPQNKSGFPLATFSYKSILAAGDKGLTHSAGALGTVSVSIIKGWFWIAWNGGKYKATGQGIFVKNFEDSVWCARAHPVQ